MGSIEIGTSYPDFEIEYKIDVNGCWKITGGRDQSIVGRRKFPAPVKGDAHDECVGYDSLFTTLIFDNTWKKNSDKQSFRYEVDGKDKLDKPDSEEGD